MKYVQLSVNPKDAEKFKLIAKKIEVSYVSLFARLVKALEKKYLKGVEKC